MVAVPLFRTISLMDDVRLDACLGRPKVTDNVGRLTCDSNGLARSANKFAELIEPTAVAVYEVCKGGSFKAESHVGVLAMPSFCEIHQKGILNAIRAGCPETV
jgi:hypothetical protein